MEKIESNDRGNIKIFKLIWELIKYRPILYLFNNIFWIIIHVTPIFMGLLLKYTFEYIEGESTFKYGLNGLIIGIIAFTIVKLVVMYYGFVTDILHRFSISAVLRFNILDEIMKKPGAKAVPKSLGEVINTYRDDVNQITDSISWLIDGIGAVVFSVISLIILMKINMKMTVLVYAPLVVIVTIAKSTTKKIKRYREEARKATSMVNGAMGEMFNSVQAIQLACKEKNMLEHLKSLNQKRKKAMIKDTLLNQLLHSIFENTISIGTGLILLVAGTAIKTESFTVGDFTLFVYFLQFVTDKAIFFGEILANYFQTGVAFRKINDITEGSYESITKHSKLYIKEAPERNEEIYQEAKEKLEELELRDLTYRYQDTTGGIENITLTIKKGTFTIITGRIGSGKTTLLRTMLGLLPKQSGEVFWNGDKVDEDVFFIPPICSYTSQVPNLLSETVKENILLGLDKSEKDINKAIYASVFEKDVKNLEKGLDTVVGSKGVKLSGGQKQRVAASRMFLRDSQLYVFDDISSALDVETEGKLWDRLFQFNNITCLAVSNRKIALKRAENIIVLKDGFIEAEGTFDELLKVSEEFRAIVNAK
ncbi:ABC transporter ATP-binding protein [Oceanirhabdus seepicola]|uniref:ABC transporter ATP-binding protein n=1 Tax=Oceanirhabdus seepicola TaxID=2828781 RepID=A0A9J6P4B8_9CLOT|nr:ABC transporter ATP-binding protein [Oceanirhabdus seepicola]MCM1990937.1 ABC transporter ATP-binding protein [Oceanirhabdus seepicola]